MCKSGNETIDIHTVSGVWLMVDEGKKNSVQSMSCKCRQFTIRSVIKYAVTNN